jgi:hypothetical protein
MREFNFFFFVCSSPEKAERPRGPRERNTHTLKKRETENTHRERERERERVPGVD